MLGKPAAVSFIRQQGGVLPGLFGKGAQATAMGIYAKKSGGGC
jgi:hypothetical protein